MLYVDREKELIDREDEFLRELACGNFRKVEEVVRIEADYHEHVGDDDTC